MDQHFSCSEGYIGGHTTSSFLAVVDREDVAFIGGSSVSWGTSALTLVVECIRASSMVMRKMGSSTVTSEV
jgi:hypothetical protein